MKILCAHSQHLALAAVAGGDKLRKWPSSAEVGDYERAPMPLMYCARCSAFHDADVAAGGDGQGGGSAVLRGFQIDRMNGAQVAIDEREAK